MNIVLCDSDRNNYINECTKILRKQFEVGIYSNDLSIIKAYELCLDFYISEFEKESLAFNTLKDAIGVVEMYSTIALQYSKDKKPTDCIVASRMLKYLMGQLTRIDIKSNKNCSVNDSMISRLFHLTRLMAELTQKIYSYYINNNTGFDLELYEDCFDFTISDTQLADKLNGVVGKNKIANIGGFQYHPGNPMNVFFEMADEAFGECVVDDLLTSIHYCDSTTVIDCNQISEKEFIEIISAKQTFNPMRRRGNEIIDLTDLYSKYPNNIFLNGLTLRGAEVDLKRNITHPHSNYTRTRFRPVLELTVDGSKRYFTTVFMFDEAINEHITNQIPFDIIPQEWLTIEIFRKYAKKQNEERATWIEGYLETILKKNNLSYIRNKKSINGMDLDKEPAVNGGNVGEIDFLVVNHDRKKIYVVECKCLKSYYDFPSFSLDKGKFEGSSKNKDKEEKTYNKQLHDKFYWVSNNMNDVRAELIKNHIELLDGSYTVDCLFLTDSKSYYSFSSLYKIFSRDEIEDYLLSS